MRAAKPNGVFYGSSEQLGILNFIKIIRFPVALAMTLIALSIANSRFGWEPRPSAFVAICYLLVRISLVVFAGYLITLRTDNGIWMAAGAGTLVFLSELSVSALWFVFLSSWADVSRVAQGFLLMFWAPAILGAVGGVLGSAHRRRGKRLESAAIR